MRLIVGLGNPGPEYEWSRHNLGFMLIDKLARDAGIELRRRECSALVGRGEIARCEVKLVKPQTYMNRSGETLQSLLRYLPVENEDLVVIHDDLDLPFGRIRIRQQGSPGGHRGMISATGVLGEQGFSRLRIGIGRPPPAIEPADFVLQSFSPDEAGRLNDIVSRAAEAVECFLEEGAQRAMEKFNRAE